MAGVGSGSLISSDSFLWQNFIDSHFTTSAASSDESDAESADERSGADDSNQTWALLPDILLEQVGVFSKNI